MTSAASAQSTSAVAWAGGIGALSPIRDPSRLAARPSHGIVYAASDLFAVAGLGGWRMQVSRIQRGVFTFLDYVAFFAAVGFLLKWWSTGRIPSVLDLSGDASRVIAVIL